MFIIQMASPIGKLQQDVKSCPKEVSQSVATRKQNMLKYGPPTMTSTGHLVFEKSFSYRSVSSNTKIEETRICTANPSNERTIQQICVAISFDKHS